MASAAKMMGVKWKDLNLLPNPAQPSCPPCTGPDNVSSRKRWSPDPWTAPATCHLRSSCNPTTLKKI